MEYYDIIVHEFTPNQIIDQDFINIIVLDPVLIDIRLNKLINGPICYKVGRYTQIFLLRDNIEKYYWYKDVDFNIVKSNNPNSSLITNDNKLDHEGYIYALVGYPFNNINADHGIGPLTLHISKDEARLLDRNLF
jgi:hypothetical protein